jgi:hypothetical protein
MRIATCAVAAEATMTKHILHELTGFVYEYLRDIFQQSKRRVKIPSLSPAK